MSVLITEVHEDSVTVVFDAHPMSRIALLMEDTRARLQQVQDLLTSDNQE